MMDQKTEENLVGAEKEKATVTFDTSLCVSDVSKTGAKAYGRSREDLIGSSWRKIVANPGPHIENSMKLSLQGKRDGGKIEIVRKDGKHSIIEVTPDHKHQSGAMTYDVEVIDGPFSPDESETKDNQCEEFKLEDMKNEKACEIATNIRLDLAGKTVTLADLFRDLLEAKKEMRQYREGSLTAYETIQTRLEEEQNRNPNSDEVRVLKAVRSMANAVHKDLK